MYSCRRASKIGTSNSVQKQPERGRRRTYVLRSRLRCQKGSRSSGSSSPSRLHNHSLMDDPLTLQNPPLSIVSTKKVPNEFPSIDVPYKLAVIGEAPGADEEAYGRPFIGASGRLLDTILNGVGILRQGCLVGNICQHRPPGNDINNFGYDHPRVLEGWEQLQSDLQLYEPNCILALGNTPLKFFTGR